ncbi:hypothetical protein ACFXG4_48465 [Nocardia sp. NPDC059246]|uniref:hypothetical protein n=1 Tax=unclassified Nocardia TaxID=2637762 RepID=UPI0036C3EFBC
MASTTDQIAAVESEQESERTDSPISPGARWRAGAMIAAAVTVLALGAVNVKLGLDVDHDHHDDDRQHSALESARRIAVQLVTLNHDSAKQNLDTIAADSTGSFRDQWDKISANFVNVLQNGKVESTGTVKEAGVVSIDADHATVLTAVTSTVKNTEAPEGQQRVYRMKMTLDNTDGRWLVSNVEFVA